MLFFYCILVIRKKNPFITTKHKDFDINSILQTYFHK